MELFKYIFYYILVHIVLTVLYQLYIYFIYKSYGIRFERKSMFFSLIRREIIENIDKYSEDQKSENALKKLLILHTALSVSGKLIIVIILVFAAIIFIYL